MMSFISQILQDIEKQKTAVSNYTFILPSKRAGAYLLHELSGSPKAPFFSPKIFSIEEFVEMVSGLKGIDNLSALFEFYTVYKANTPKDKTENFETFSSWAQTLLYDFNEVDRYLIDIEPFFGYLSGVQDIKHWSLTSEKTPLIENYLSFWRQLPDYYQKLTATLQKKGQGYQGMVYRKAAKNIESYISKNKSPHVFIGFNALNNAEQHIFKKMLDSGNTQVFWDTDVEFFNDLMHDAAMFLRQYRKWPQYKNKPFHAISNNFEKQKNISIVGISNAVGQAKYVGELLAKMNSEELKYTAVVLGDENLLLPVLNSLPPNAAEINITMGFPLKNSPLAFLFEQLLKMQARYQKSLYYKDILAITNHPFIQKATSGASLQISNKILETNIFYLSYSNLEKWIPVEFKGLFQNCFQNWNNKPETAMARLQDIVLKLKTGLDRDKNALNLEFLYRFNLLFNKLSNLLETYPHIISIKSLHAIYKDLISTQTVDFKGKPFSGLQLMGVLESRALDFKNVIVTSVNEGIFPAGKSTNSFIPYELKADNKLPTYKEKDAIYTYHFYHLLQRAKNVSLLYNTSQDALRANEKSRFLMQLEHNQMPAHSINKYWVSAQVPAISPVLKTVEKTPEILEKIKALAAYGFSPSALTTYIRNPLDFYHHYVLGVKESEEIEETIAHNTLGTVVHDTLEFFYKPWEGEVLTTQMLLEAKKEVATQVEQQFLNTYSKAPLSGGKNLLIFEVAKRYVTNFLNAEIDQIKKGNHLKMLQVETKLKSEIKIEELSFSVFLRGKVDRVDILNQNPRIIDYKTGKVEQKQVELIDWNLLTSDYEKYGKIFQILAYTLMIDQENPFPYPVEAGIISFKNLKKGFLRFCKKESDARNAKKNPEIDADVLLAYQKELKKLIIEICNPQIPFIEKEIPQRTW